MKQLARIHRPLCGLLLLLSLLISAFPVFAKKRTTLPICAGMGLKDALMTLKNLYEERHSDILLEINFASSGALQKQIEQGAPAELFLAAGQKEMNALEAQNLIVQKSRCDLLGNTLVLIVAEEKKHQIRSFSDLPKHAASFAIGHPGSVPAGRYGKETLTSLDLWSQMESRMVLAKNVRAVLAYVDSGNADAGLVYRTDTLMLGSAVIAATPPANSHSPIVFPAALIANGRYPAETRQFFEFLQSSEAGEIFARYGFTPLLKKP